MEYLDERDLHIFTDGSSYSGPRRGGVGILFVTTNEAGEEQVDDYPRPGYEGATNNQMEIQACIVALQALATRRGPVDPKKYRQIVIWSDSMYVVNGFQSAQSSWPLNDWNTRSGNPVANATQWRELIKVAGRAHRRVEIRWVKGHKSSKHNKAADKLAKQSSKDQPGQRVGHARVRRKKTSRSTEIGSVRLTGQRLTIRIVAEDYLPVQKMNKWTYEVMSKKSPYYGFIDVIYARADMTLRAGHTYQVRMNDDTMTPRITKVFREVV
jgi:ribonuclease HI